MYIYMYMYIYIYTYIYSTCIFPSFKHKCPGTSQIVLKKQNNLDLHHVL